MNTLTDGSILRALGVALERDEAQVARPVELVHVCAWCDFDKSQTRALVAQGKKVSHTICAAHKAEQMQRIAELNRQADGGVPQQEVAA